MLTLIITTLPLVNRIYMYVISHMCIHVSAFIHVPIQNIHMDFFTHVPTEHIVCMPLHLRTQKTIHMCTYMYAYRHRHAEGAYILEHQGGTSSLSTGHCLRLRRLWLSYPMPQKKPS